jgi:hypothetical protein
LVIPTPATNALPAITKPFLSPLSPDQDMDESTPDPTVDRAVFAFFSKLRPAPDAVDAHRRPYDRPPAKRLRSHAFHP